MWKRIILNHIKHKNIFHHTEKFYFALCKASKTLVSDCVRVWVTEWPSDWMTEWRTCKFTEESFALKTLCVEQWNVLETYRCLPIKWEEHLSTSTNHMECISVIFWHKKMYILYWDYLSLSPSSNYRAFISSLSPVRAANSVVHCTAISLHYMKNLIIILYVPKVLFTFIQWVLCILWKLDKTSLMYSICSSTIFCVSSLSRDK